MSPARPEAGAPHLTGKDHLDVEAEGAVMIIFSTPRETALASSVLALCAHRHCPSYVSQRRVETNEKKGREGEEREEKRPEEEKRRRESQ